MCVRACVRACVCVSVRACVRACVRVCVFLNKMINPVNGMSILFLATKLDGEAGSRKYFSTAFFLSPGIICVKTLRF